MSTFRSKYGASIFMLFLASALAGMADALLTALSSGRSVVPTILAVFSLTTLMFVAASLFVALVFAGMFRDATDLTGLPGRLLDALFPADRHVRTTRTLMLAAGLISSVVFLAVVALAGVRFVEAMRTTLFATISTACVALVTALILFGGLYRFRACLVRTRASTRTAVGGIIVSPAALALVVIAACVAGAVVMNDLVKDILAAVPLRQTILVAIWLLTAVGIGIARGWNDIAAAIRLLTLGGVPVLTAFALTMTMIGVGFNNDVRMALTTDGVLSPKAFRVARLALDFDRDGYIGFMGDGDCAPMDPNRSPGVKERPNNKVDEDCDGEDLKFDRDLDTFFGRWDFDLPAAIKSKKYNVFLITIDAAAPARMSLYGYDRPTTPFLEKFATESAWFKSAWAPGPSTRLAIPEVMTSKYGPQVERAVGYKVPLEIRQGNTTIAEILKRSGFRTWAIMPTAYFTSWKGMTQGFDTVDKSAVRFDTRANQNHTGARVTEALIANLKKASADKLRPVFMWAHYYDPHSPYTKVMDGKDFGTERADLYDSELRYADEQIGIAVAEIDKEFDPAKTIIIITADHGEAFDANHATKHHGHDLHSTILHVPLLVRAPFVKPGVFEGPVSTLDILPTLMNLHNIKGRHKLVGTSLVPQLVDGIDDVNRTIYSMFYLPENVYHKVPANIMVGVRTRDYNYFRHLETSVEHLYKYLDDPFESDNLIDSMPFKGREMRRKGGQFLLWLAENSVGSKKQDKPPVPARKPAKQPAEPMKKAVVPRTVDAGAK